MLNNEQFQNKWHEIRGGIKNLWGKLTDDELNLTHGNLTSIAGLIESKYGETRETIKEKLETLMSSFDNDTDKGIIGLESSYQRAPELTSDTPNAIRTSSDSQFQDITQDLKTRGPERNNFDNKSYESRVKDIGSASYNGASNNEVEEDDRNFGPQKAKKKRIMDDQIVRH